MSFAAAPSPELLQDRLLALLGGASAAERIEGWTLVHVDVDEGLGFVFEAPGGRSLKIGVTSRDDALPHYAQSASFNISYSTARRCDGELGTEAAALVGEVVRRIQHADDGSLLLRGEAPSEAHGDIRTTRVTSLLSRTTVEGRSYYTANPYVGCLIGCGFCYAQEKVALVRRLAGYLNVAWGRYVLVKENAPEVLDAELRSLPPLPVVFTPLVADPYQSVERKLLVTRRCLEVLAHHGVRGHLLTRSALVERDIDVFERIPGMTVGFSVPTDREEVARAYEPRAAPIAQRLRILGRLRERGVRTIAVVQPLLAMNPDALAERLAQVSDLVRVDCYRPAESGGARLLPVIADGPPPPADETALLQEFVAALRLRGVPLWTAHFPP